MLVVDDRVPISLLRRTEQSRHRRNFSSVSSREEDQYAGRLSGIWGGRCRPDQSRHPRTIKFSPGSHHSGVDTTFGVFLPKRNSTREQEGSRLHIAFAGFAPLLAPEHRGYQDPNPPISRRAPLTGGYRVKTGQTQRLLPGRNHENIAKYSIGIQLFAWESSVPKSTRDRQLQPTRSLRVAEISPVMSSKKTQRIASADWKRDRRIEEYHETGFRTQSPTQHQRTWTKVSVDKNL